jgi:hypothetical protein
MLQMLLKMLRPTCALQDSFGAQTPALTLMLLNTSRAWFRSTLSYPAAITCGLNLMPSAFATPAP